MKKQESWFMRNGHWFFVVGIVIMGIAPIVGAIISLSWFDKVQECNQKANQWAAEVRIDLKRIELGLEPRNIQNDPPAKCYQEINESWQNKILTK